MLTNKIEHYRKDAEVFDYFEVTNPGIRDQEVRRHQFLGRFISFSAGTLVIDCGSGSGWVAQEYLKRGVKIVSIDISDKNLRRVQQLYDKQNMGYYIVADLNALPFKNGLFDGATSNDVFEHLEQPIEAATEIYRCLKQGGKLYVSVPYKENIVYYLCIHCNKPTPINAHLHSFDENSLSKLFATAGFTINKFSKFVNKGLSITLVYYALCRWMPYWLWRLIDNLANMIIKKQDRIAIRLVKSK
jgi:ubiquinone/menaquinone biosynthesis C-methylase UbiE